MHPLLLPVLQVVALVTGVFVVLFAVNSVRARKDAAGVRKDWAKVAIALSVVVLPVVAFAAGPWPTAALVLPLAWLSWSEVVGAVATKFGPMPFARLASVVGTLAALSGLFGIQGLVAGLILATAMLLAAPMLLAGRPVAMHAHLVGLFCLLYLSLPLGLLVVLARDAFGPIAFLWAVAVANDGASMAAGKLAGRTPLSPGISPNKTVEGALGGLAGALGTGWLLRFAFPTWPAWQVLALAGGIAAVSLVGDLVASSLKREAGIKDFGRALAVTGGVLDKLDSVFFALPLVYLVVSWS